MGIERKTPAIGLDILETGTKSWGQYTNNNWDLTDTAIGADRSRITSLETISAVLPLAIVGKVGSNLLRNNIFTQSTLSDVYAPTHWTTEFFNGSSGYSVRDSSTYLVGTNSFRISIFDGSSLPVPNLKMKDPETDIDLSNTDVRQLANKVGYAFQATNLTTNTRYTLSAYAKADIINLALRINTHWKIGIVFKDVTDQIIYSYFTQPQINRTNLTTPDSFLYKEDGTSARAELSFKTPAVPSPTVKAEIWIVAEGSVPTGIGSVWFGGIQLEQAVKATALDLFSMNGSNFIIDGDLIVGGNLSLQQENLFFESSQVTFTGSVQIGDNINEDVLTVYTKSATFYGPLAVEGNVKLGSDPTNGLVDITAKTTTFYNDQNVTNPQGGNVLIQGNLQTNGDVVLGSSIENTVTFNASTVLALNDLVVAENLEVQGGLKVDRGVEIGTNSPTDSFTVKMADQGSSFEGNVEFKNDVKIDGSTIVGDNLSDTLLIKAGITTIEGSVQIDNTLDVNGASTFDIGTNDFIVNGTDFLITSTGQTKITTDLLEITGNALIGSGNVANINDISTTFGNIITPLSTFNIYSDDTSIFGNTAISGDIVAQGNTFTFGNKLSIAPSGEIKIGDQSAISGNIYNNILKIYAGTTYFGDTTSQDKGSVQIGGDLVAIGDINLGSILKDIQLVGHQVDIITGSGNLNIAGGFRNQVYDNLASDHGGITAYTNGNIALDGKLITKGPIVIDGYGTNVVDALTIKSGSVIPTTIFNVTSLGSADASNEITVGSGNIARINSIESSFGKSTQKLQQFEIYADNTNIIGDAYIGGNLSVDTLTIRDISINGNDMQIAGSLTVDKDIISTGTYYAFGSSPADYTVFNVKANQTTFGNGTNVGDVIIGNNLSVINDLTIGIPSSYQNTIDLNGRIVADLYDANFYVQSDKQDMIERAGFRINGGFQNNPFDSEAQNHGGITMDAYGNLFMDGSLVVRGDFGFETLTLSTAQNVDPYDSIFKIIDTSDGYNVDPNMVIDGYGNVRTDGYIWITGSDASAGEHSLGLGVTGLLTSNILFKLDRITPNVVYGEYHYGEMAYRYDQHRVLDIDDYGNLRTHGYLHTVLPGRSNLSAYAATIGDGYLTFGDFNGDGYVYSHDFPINDAIDYLYTRGIIGTIFIKNGKYVLNGDTTIPAGMSIKGEGEFSIIDGYGFILEDGARVQDVKIKNASIGVKVKSTAKRALVSGNFITSCSIGIQIDGSESIISNNFVTDNSTSGIIINGSDNMVSSNITLRNP